MMWLLCDRNGDRGETGVMRAIQLCSMANWGLCSGVDEDGEGNNSFKHCYTGHIYHNLWVIVVIMLLYHNLDITAASGEWSSGGQYTATQPEPQSNQ